MKTNRMTRMDNTTFAIKWHTHENNAEQQVATALEHLDRRKKALKDEAVNKRIVTSLLAQRHGEFTVSMATIPKPLKEPLREVLECLVGPVLVMGRGRSTYALRDEYRASEGLFITAPPPETNERRAPPIKTQHGTIYRDGTHDEIPFSDIKLFGYSRPSLVTIVAPHQHWRMFVGGEKPPSANWQTISETEDTHECHDELMNLIASQGNMRGVAIVRYGHDSFLATNPDAVVFTIDTTLVRYTGKSGQRPLLNITDIYQRQHLRWGGKA